jgi:hypothetical protein
MLSWNNCSSKKPISITYLKCVSVALVIQHAMRMRRIVIRLYKIFFHFMAQTVRHSEKRYLTKNTGFDFLHNFYLNISHYKSNSAI